ncbi:dynein axonemal heavy chain 3-like isoform X3 [Eriocheir sinensis]|uniref:dynein axonemal heavy chain 3-like isoform X3 n=1 Tax=Eriocheir sinensis TaxID=95602 RepID=UPI0021C61C1E|nr:dynein axonemal heavy chain 3-like isoform X3 [Eriocheir sinensis]
MAGQENFFSTPVGARRGVPPLRLERCHSARTRKPLPSSVAFQKDVVTVKKELDVMQEKSLHPLGSSFSETSYHARSTGTSSNSSDGLPAVLNVLEHGQPLPSLESQNTYVKASKLTVVKEKSVGKKPANEGKRMTKKLEAEKIEEAEKSDFPPLLLDNFKTKAVLAKQVSQVLTPSERIGSNLTPYSYLVRIPPRFPHGRHSYSVLPYIRYGNSKSPGSNESRVVVISKLLLHKHPLWAMSQFASSSVKTARLTHHSQLSTNQDLGCPRISPAGMKVIQEFRLHDVLRKQEERVKTKGGRYKIQKQHLRKLNKKVKGAVRYKEATQLCGLEEQLQRQKEARAHQPLPSEQDLGRYEEYLQRIQDHQVTTPPSNLLKVVTLDVDKMVLRNIRFRLVVSELVEELSDCYLKGVRHAVLRYALLSPAVRAKLKITVAPDEHEPFVVRAPVPWHQNFITGAHHCYHNLFALNHVLAALDALWDERFSSLRFVDMRVLVGERDQPVLTPLALEAAVRAQCLQTRTLLLQKWLPGVARIFEELIGAWRELVPTEAGDSLRQVRRFFSAVRSRMSLQLRSLVLASINDFRNCLLQHKAGNSYSGEYVEEKYIEKAVVEVSVAVEHHRVSFQPPLQKTHECLLGCVASIIEHNQCIPRIERLLFPDMSRRKLYLQAVSQGEEAVQEVWSDVSRVFAANSSGPSTYISLYDQYTHLLDGSTCTAVHDFIADCGVLKEGKKLLANLQKLGGEAVQLCDMVPLGLILLNCHQINQQLQQQVQELTTSILDYFVSRNKEHDKDICRSFDDMSTKLSQVTDVTAEIVELSNYLHICSSQTMTQLLQEIQNATDRLLFLLQFGKVPEDQVQLINRMYAWPHKIQEDFRLAEARLSHKRDLKETALKARVANFEKTLQVHHRELEDMRSRDNFIMKEIRVDTMKRNVETLDRLTVQLQEAMNELQGINEEQSLLSWEMTKFPLLQSMISLKEPYDQLWHTTYDFHQKYEQWYNGPFVGLDAESISEEVEDMWRTMSKLTKTFMDQVGSRRVAEYVKERIEKFRLHVPVLQCICSPGLRERHWTQLGEHLGTELNLTPETSLADMIEAGLPKVQRKLEEISHAASKEFNLEKALEKMKAEWASVMFEFKPWRETGVSILAAVDDIQVLLDEHTQKVQTMRGSPYVKPFETEIRSWEDKLLSMQDILDAWIKCQVTWLYLEPIFSSEDIMKQMPVEGRKFTSVDQTWRDLMTTAVKDPHALVATQQPNMLPRLHESNRLLEEIQKGLNDYLEKKRLFFPRFFFLSNDELLEILSETKDPQRVQPHLKKCFEGINRLHFSPQQEIEGMISSEGELVQFSNRVIPAKARGLVERWLVEVEEMMVQSVQDVAVRAVENHPLTPHSQWIGQWPSQVVLTVSQIIWTSQVMAAIPEDGLKQYLEKCEAKIQEVVQLVRGRIEYGLRLTLGALIVIYVHGRDVVQELLKKGVSSTSDFTWEAQMRYYWINELVVVNMIFMQLQYGYEYLGNTSRLVITPLTDRCFRTLMGALKLHLGGALEGPAGTGKTESCKDLAKAVAKQCIIFNCSDGLDYKAMAKFFKGLAQSGAWACFDEFNRIQLSVLSVVGQQIQTIQAAVARRAQRFIFEGVDLLLNPSCTIFITMNPGYAGRRELPDSLKVLFRSVAMMVPDYIMIARIVLFSMGFIEADSLARKIIHTYRLCSEQLSTQHHYDYGMRAVKAVLQAASNLRLLMPDMSEAQVIRRAIADINLPKFIAQDIPLFDGIVQDLFPSEKDNVITADQTLETAIKNTLAENNLQYVPWFRDKMVQLYNMVLVRHGVMVVGEPLSGKTKAYQGLASALEKVGRENKTGEEQGVQYKIINPKAITLGQLYGAYDPFSHEWSDGVLAKTFREMAVSGGDERRWLVLDGPIDAVWVENLNTVLDDNKKLCLMSGEIIQMPGKMSVIFETCDLEEASPATVSRCGMIYMESKELGWRPLKDSYLESLPGAVKPEVKQMLDQVIEWLLPPLFDFVMSKCRFMIQTSELHLFQSFIRLLDAHLDEVREADKPLGPKISEDKLTSLLQHLVTFVLPWSLGSLITSRSRCLFDQFFRKILQDKVEDAPKPECFKLSKSMLPPESGLMYDFMYEKERQRWVSWHDSINQNDFVIPTDAKVSQLLIPTAETARQDYFLRNCLYHDVPMLLLGPSGTGKTAVTNSTLNDLPRDKFIINAFHFSARTTAGQAQDIIMSKVDRRRKGVYGPAMGRKYVVFIDDVNLPKKEAYGAQPPIEFLRQWLDHHHFYDKKDSSKIELVDSLFIGAMMPPSADRSNICGRFTRHLNVIYLDTFDDETLDKIFGSIMSWHFSSQEDAAIQQLSKTVVEATREVYRRTVSSFLPTPAKRHYVFNLRDFSRVMCGILLVPNECLTSVEKLIRLWLHETIRVFHDRLCDGHDRQKYFMLVQEICLKAFHCNMKDVLVNLVEEEEDLQLHHLNNLIFGNYMIPEAENPVYDEIQDMKKLQQVMEKYLQEYNLESKSQLSLVLFHYLIQHVSRISRVLQQHSGHALLIGLAGSGRQSAAKLAAFMAKQEFFQIQVTKTYGVKEWRDDIKKVLMAAGGDGRSTVFLLTDAQVKDESFIEDVNTLINSGDLPNLYSSEEKTEILEKMQSVAIDAGKKNDMSPGALLEFFTERVKANLHLVISLSPLGHMFNNSLRMFPSLVNCCTINWFTNWPEEALEMVATSLLQVVQFEAPLLGQCVAACKYFHYSAKSLANTFLEQLRRRHYVTSSSYLELVLTFRQLLLKKKEEILTLRDRYVTGLEKLKEAKHLITELQEELKLLQPRLVETSANTEALMIKIEQDTIQVERKKELVAADEAVANKKFADAQAIKDDCEKELAKAVPALNAATDALNTLKQDDIRVVKAMKNPPSGVKLVMEAVCVMLDLKPERKPDASGSGKMVEDFWTPSQKLLGDMKFLQNLLQYDKENIPTKIISHVRTKFYSHPDFDPKKIRMVSMACEGLCRWVRAMVVYDQVIKIVAPKKQALEAANHELALQNEKLEEKRKELREVTDKLQALNDEFTKKQKEKKDLEDSIVRCEQKRDRSERLIGGLGGERERWSNEAQTLSESLENVVGDVLIAAAFIAYLGAFTVEYRQKCLDDWHQKCSQLGISCSAKFSLYNTLGDNVQCRTWHLYGLPVDSFSVDNAIVVSQSRRWPLMIDPQGQAHKWVVNMEKESGLQVVKQTNPAFMNILEKSLEKGLPLLIEGVGEELDPILDNVLLKQTFTRLGVEYVKLGDADVEYHSDFRLYLTTRLRNPHYLPQVTTKVLSQEITAKERIVEETELEIDAARGAYQPVATHASVLFFCVSDLAAVEPMYQFSLGWFIALYLQSTKTATPSQDVDTRISLLNSHLTRAVFLSVSRSLFEKDKILFTFILCVRLQHAKGCLDDDVWRFLLTGVSVHVELNGAAPPPQALWLTNKVWAHLVQAGQCSSLEDVHKHVAEHLEAWEEVFQSDTPHLAQFPEPYSTLEGINRLALIKCLRPDKIILAVQNLIRTQFGEEYLSPPQFDIGLSFDDSTCYTPLIFILSPGTDPIGVLNRFAQERETEVKVISMGQGQGVAAENLVSQGASEGLWVVLQNCHLADESWLAKLEVVFGQVLEAEEVHPNFRLWLTSYPCKAFPVSLLQDGIKITNEPPRGLRANLLNSYHSDPIKDSELLASPDPDHVARSFQRLLYGLCFFHALAQERRHFGTLGWNVSYEFNESDMRISVKQLQMLLAGCAKPEDVPFEALTYLTGECNYGGRVTDPKDHRLLLCLLRSFYNIEMMENDRYQVFGVVEYQVPPESSATWQAYVDHIEGLPLSAPPQVFGLHASADIAKDHHEADKLFREILYFEPQFNNKIGEDAAVLVARDLACEILGLLPPLFDLKKAEERHPITYKQSLNTVLRQELLRYNRLTATIKSSLKDVKKAVSGEQVICEETETAYQALMIGQLPPTWKIRSYPTNKSLAPYISDLLHRLKFFQRWSLEELPDVFWFSGLFFPHTFLTGVRQNYARHHSIPIDRIYFQFLVMDKEVDDIIHECIRPNFVELPQVFEELPSPANRGQCDTQDTDVEDEIPSAAEENTSQDTENGNEKTKEEDKEDVQEEEEKNNSNNNIEDLCNQDCKRQSIIYDVLPMQDKGGTYTWGFFLEGAQWDREKRSLTEMSKKKLHDQLPVILFQPAVFPEGSDNCGFEENGYFCPVYRTSQRSGSFSTTGHSSNFILDLLLPSSHPPQHWVCRGAAALTQLDE